ncbi:hypothetical protein Q5691_27425, partial [Microcoleus sp. w1-18aA5]
SLLSTRYAGCNPDSVYLLGLFVTPPASKADLWIFFIPQQEILVVEPGKFRLLVLQQQPELPQKVVPNRGYSVTGLPVPLVKVRNIASHVFKFPDVLF